MKADREFDGGGGPEDLRTILRQWRVPGLSPEIEDQLRRTFRRGRSKKRRFVWLTLAASLAVAASLALLLAYPKAPGRVAERAASVAPPAPPPLIAEPNRVGTRGPAHASPAHPKRVPAVPPALDEVIVEPRQAELLAELARQLRGTRQGGPGVSWPRIEVIPADAPPSPIRKAQTHDNVPQHRTHWEEVESEWPFAHRSL